MTNCLENKNSKSKNTIFLALMIFKPAQLTQASSCRFLCCCIPFSQIFFLNHLKSLEGHSKLIKSHLHVHVSHGVVL